MPPAPWAWSQPRWDRNKAGIQQPPLQVAHQHDLLLRHLSYRRGMTRSVRMTCMRDQPGEGQSAGDNPRQRRAIAMWIDANAMQTHIHFNGDRQRAVRLLLMGGDNGAHAAQSAMQVMRA